MNETNSDQLRVREPTGTAAALQFSAHFELIAQIFGLRALRLQYDDF